MRNLGAIVGGLFVALLAVLLLGWHKPLAKEARRTVEGAETVDPIVAALDGRDCIPSDAAPEVPLEDGRSLFTCKLVFKQLDSLVEDHFCADIISDAFLIHVLACTDPDGKRGLFCNIGPGGDPTGGNVFVPEDPRHEASVELRATVCMGPTEGADVTVQDPQTGATSPPPTVSVSLAGASRECALVAPWEKAGWPVVFDFTPLSTGTYDPGEVLTVTDVRFFGTPANCGRLSSSDPAGDRFICLAGSGDAFSLSVVRSPH